MGFLQSYLRLPKYQRILLGVSGIALGWYGPSLMSYLFLSHEDSHSKSSPKSVTPSNQET